MVQAGLGVGLGAVLIAGLLCFGAPASQQLPANGPPIGSSDVVHVEMSPYGLRNGTCLRGDEPGSLHPSDVVACSEPHYFEVIAVIHLDALLGRMYEESDGELAGAACDREYEKFTGAALKPGARLQNVGVLDTTPGGPSYTVCLIGTDPARAGSARNTQAV